MSDRVLFISGRCPHSKKVLMGIQQYSFLKDLFKIVNVDTQPFPNYVKTVPSILINNQVVSGEKVFEYFGKLVEAKEKQEEREKSKSLTEKDEGQCRINDDGLLEGYCGNGMDLDFALITEESDDFTKKTYKMDSCLSFLEYSSDEYSIKEKIQNMEESDSHLGQKRQQFDNDLEKMQRERGEMEGGNRPQMLR